MKPAPFTYHSPRTLDEAVAVLASVASEDGRILAGGQSLVPMMALRLAYPPHLVDINGVRELDRIAVEAGTLVVGALARHTHFERPVEPGPTGRLLAEICRYVGHYPIRARGTFCGSLVNADPASEWCLAAVTLGASLTTRSVSGERTIPASAFFQGVMTTDLRPDEILTHVRIPLLEADSRFGFYEFSRRAGDFAIAMSLVTFRVVDGLVASAAIGVGGAEDHPRRITDAEAAVNGRRLGPDAIAAAAEAAAAAVDPLEDAVTDGVYRRDLVRTAVSRALSAALARSAQNLELEGSR